MSTLRYTPEDYRNLLKMSRRKHLLVEGSGDHRFFLFVVDEFREIGIIEGPSFDIDTAETLIEFDGPIGNRAKVEEICRSVNGLSYAGKLVGFVDREFREFDLTSRLQDGIVEHRVSDRLVWSRGHSVENYFFDRKVLRPSLRDTGLFEQFPAALELFFDVFESVICLACIWTLVGYELEALSVIKGSIDHTIFIIESPRVIVKLDGWKRNIVRMGHQESFAQHALERFHHWEQVVNASDFDTVRWLCHGHIGMKTIWEIYEACFSGARTNGVRMNPGTLRVSESLHFNLCSSNLIRNINQITEDGFPFEVFRLLGIHI